MTGDADIEHQGACPASRSATGTVVELAKGNAAGDADRRHLDGADLVWATGTVTATRAVTLVDDGGLQPEPRFKVIRKATATGAFTLDVGTGPLARLGTGEWCDVVFDGTAWVLAAFGEIRSDGRTNVKAYGATGDGVTDDTAAINAALAAGLDVFFPAGTYMVNAVSTSANITGGIAPRSNSRLTLHPNATIKAIATDQVNYNVVRLTDVDNVSITGGTIQGERAGHIGATGEAGHGIAIRGGSNIWIRI